MTKLLYDVAILVRAAVMIVVGAYPLRSHLEAAAR